MIRGDNPVTYKLLPGFSTSLDRLLDRLRYFDLDIDLLYLLYGEGEREYLDLLEYDIVSSTYKINSLVCVFRDSSSG